VTRNSRRRIHAIVAAAIISVFALALILWSSGNKPDKSRSPGQDEGDRAEQTEGEEVELSPEALEAAGIEIVSVSERPAVALLRVSGAVGANQEQTQQVTPLVSGRVERVNVALGDRVRAGAVLAIVSSPDVAEMHGKLHEAETRLMLAQQNYERVQRAENRATLLQAKARLEEAEANLRRTRRVIELGAGAGKDLVAAEAAYKSAKAEYDYQSNISLNREVQQARAEVETARVETLHLRNSLRALGAVIPEQEDSATRHDTSEIALVAPVSGTVTERLVNAGAGIEAGKHVFTISNIATVWVIANVPESQISLLRVGTPAEVRSAAVVSDPIAGKVTYIDPMLNEETRTGRVRIVVNNPGERLKVGMFVEVGFEASDDPQGSAVGTELVAPDSAVQRIGDRTVVFVPKQGEPGHFQVRDVELGGMVDGHRRVISGLQPGDRVVTRGSFTLKTQLLKGEMGERGH
jgi:cobalt-zinc-cadmium efflux system membrane fusion protein